MYDENLITTTEELSRDQWWLILWSLIADVPVKEWNEFAHDLIYKDCFSSSHKVIEVIQSFSGKCTATIKKGQVLYRARIYDVDPITPNILQMFVCKC